MLALKALSMLIFIIIGMLMLTRGTILTMTKGLSIHQIPLLDAQQEFPLIPSITLTVCPEGPPTCDFKKIQDAIHAAPETPPVTFENRKPVAIPQIKIAPGTYQENLIVLKSVWLQGAGREQTTVMGKLEGLDAKRPTIFVAGSWHITVGITHMKIVGNSEAIQVVGRVSGLIAHNSIQPRGDTGVGGIWLTGAFAHLLIASNLIKGGKSGIVLQGVKGWISFDSPFIPLNARHGILIAHNEITGCHFDYPYGGDGIDLNNAHGIWIAVNHLYDNDTGIQLYGSTAIDIDTNILEENDYGIQSWKSTDVQIWQNLIARNEGPGIELLPGSSNIRIEINRIVSNNHDGIRSDYSPDLGIYIGIEILHMNHIEHNQGYGINLDPRFITRCEANQVSSNKNGDYSSEELRAKCGG
ncbi:MAG: right-handed parallel beta-helix repeat-containing protein [Candidatus Bipolaricaulota bacterium]|nr:right-handed parallel beta-helix repeat-containing protein [Candidatus Bipolaricaulota bacterium]